ncbi:MAG: amidohydrolase [Cyanobacteria bacterium RI_101]|nr:amidohydrolase [Cyanobacteria bacterium RI_101]
MLSALPTASPFRTDQIRLELRSLLPRLIHWRRQLHQMPELGFQERRTAEFISQTLTGLGIPHQTGVAQTGIVALVDSGKPGPVLAIRADMDALPVTELNEVEYRSQIPGAMHACGHDGHAAIALGTAHYLSEHPETWRGQVKFIFQPAEESPGGAKPMIEAGVLANPPVEAIVGLHLWNNLPAGTVGVCPGPLMAAVECFHCTLLGKGGHGAMPHQTVDAVVLGAQVVTALQGIVARNVDPLKAAVVTVGEFHSGSALNVIADSARLRGTVRYFDPSFEGYFGRRLESVIQGICQGQGADYELNYWRLYPPVINNESIAQQIGAIAQRILGQEALIPNCQTMGGEDMSFFLEAVPGCYFFLGAANSALGLDFPHHHPRFNFDESVLPLGVEIFTRFVEEYGA